MQLLDGKTAVINNVYLPPQKSLRRREIPEAKARQDVMDIVSAAPLASHVITVGDFNTRTGTLAPRVGETQLQRASEDSVVCPRAGWLVELCELTEVHILNGATFRRAAPFTCFTHRGKSAVDYVLCNHPGRVVHYDDVTLAGYSDHAMLWVRLPIDIPPPPPREHAQPPAATSYRWDVGPAIQD